MRRAFLLIAVLAATLCGWAVNAAASVPYGIDPTGQVIHLQFHRVAGGVVGCGAVTTSGDETLIPFTGSGAGTCTGAAVINDRTHTRFSLPDSAHRTVLAFGPPWVLYQTPKRRQLLYDMKTGRTEPCGVGCEIGNRELDGDSLGRDWLEIDDTSNSCPQAEGCEVGHLKYYNLITHAIRRDVLPPAGMVIDLNSPRLIVRACTPSTSKLSLSIRSPSAVDPTGPGLIGLFGRFQLTGASGPYTVTPCGQTSSVYTIDNSGQYTVFGNPRILLWPPYYGPDNWLQGLELPRITPIAFPLAPGLVPATYASVFADNEALYVVTSKGQVFSARLPVDQASS